jgi:Predicted hydrolases or acyltransferases (alpha/beta hydrolase superfamily)
MAQLQFTLSSGRRVGVTVHGNPTGAHVVVFVHPAPGTGVFDPDPQVSADPDVRIVSIDRAGYGSFDPLPDGRWPTVAGVADDIAEYLHAVEHAANVLNPGTVRAFGAVGWSAGGRVALALAARHPRLVDRVVAIATPAPDDAVRWIPEQFAEQSRRLATVPAADALERLGEALLQQHGGRLPGADPDGAIPLSELGANEADAAVLRRPGVRDRLEAMVRDAYRQGAIGVATDILSYTARRWASTRATFERRRFSSTVRPTRSSPWRTPSGTPRGFRTPPPCPCPTSGTWWGSARGRARWTS